MGDRTIGRKERLERSDLVWLVAFPIYLGIGTLRHEGSHALVAWLEGAHVDRFVVWPQRDLGSFSWGYVTWSGETTWLSVAAPYLVSAAVFGVVAVICRRARLAHWLWVNLVVVGMASPLIDVGYNLGRGLLNSSSDGFADVARLRAEFADGLVVGLFGGAVLVGVAVLANTAGMRTPRR